MRGGPIIASSFALQQLELERNNYARLWNQNAELINKNAALENELRILRENMSKLGKPFYALDAGRRDELRRLAKERNELKEKVESLELEVIKLQIALIKKAESCAEIETQTSKPLAVDAGTQTSQPESAIAASVAQPLPLPWPLSRAPVRPEPSLPSPTVFGRAAAPGQAMQHPSQEEGNDRGWNPFR